MARAYFGIGLHRPKTLANMGSVLRIASCYGAADLIVQEPPPSVSPHPERQLAEALFPPSSSWHATVVGLPVGGCLEQAPPFVPVETS